MRVSNTDRTSSGSAPEQGFALIVTLLVAAVLFIAIFTITANLALGNRTTARDQEMTNRAQLLADSGLGRLNEQHARVQDILERLNINFVSAVTPIATQQDQLFRQLYRFCYGDPVSPPIGAPAYTTFLGAAQATPLTVTTVCDALPVDTGLSNSELAAARLPLFTERLDETDANVYGAVLNAADEQNFWATLARGEGSTHLVGSDAGMNDQYVATMTLQPVRLAKQSTSFILTVGNQADVQTGLNARGQVVDGGSSDVLADRRVVQSSLVTVRLVPPNFARLGYFYDQNNNAGGLPVRLGSGFSVDGPFHTNGNVLFESNTAQPMRFSSEFRSAGCPNGATTTTIGSIVTPVCRPLDGQLTNPTPDMAYFLGDMEPGSRRVPPSDDEGRASMLDPDLNADFVQRDSSGNELCDEGSGTAVCSGSATEDQKLRDVDWAAAPIPMPTGALSTFEAQGDPSNGGFTLDRSMYHRPWHCDYWINPGDTISPTPPSTAAPGAYPLPASCVNAIGKYTGEPIIRLTAHGGTQEIVIEGDVIRRYELEVHKRCEPLVLPPPPPPPPPPPVGDPNVYVPREPEFLVSLGSWMTDLRDLAALITPFSTANAAPGWPTCNAGQVFNGYLLRWQARTEKARTGYLIDANGNVTIGSGHTNNIMTNQYGQPSVPVFPPVNVNLANPFSGVVFATGDLSVNVVSLDWHNPGHRSRPEIASYMKLSIVSGDDISVLSDLTYETDPEANPGATNILGLYAGDDVEINPWDQYQSSSYQDLNLDAIIMAQGGSFEVERVCEAGKYRDKGNLNIRGSILQSRVGATACTFSGEKKGYSTQYRYDRRTLNGFAPPAFPTFTTAPWTITLEATDGRFFRARSN